MYCSDLTYHHGAQTLKGFVAYQSGSDQPRPAVLVVHDWSGRNAFACDKARMLADLGYVGFAVDMYGRGRVGNTTEEKIEMMNPVASDRALLRDRIIAALEAIKAIPQVDKTKIAVIGFCFGGLCALDLARSGADIKGTVCFHGLLARPEGLPSNPIKSKVLVLHGYDDPMVTPNLVNDFCEEMTQAKVDWQVHMYGHTKHAFANPEAHDEKLGTVYDAVAERRSMQSMTNFLAEVFL